MQVGFGLDGAGVTVLILRERPCPVLIGRVEPEVPEGSDQRSRVLCIRVLGGWDVLQPHHPVVPRVAIQGGRRVGIGGVVPCRVRLDALHERDLGRGQILPVHPIPFALLEPSILLWFDPIISDL